MQRSPYDKQRQLHIAIIMDGNGRWATRRGLPRAIGHRAGAEALRAVVEAAPSCGIITLSVFAFSADNWKRPAGEVALLMGLLRTYLAREAAKLCAQGIRLSVIGRRDRLDADTAAAIATAEQATRDGARLHLRIAVDYSSRDAIADALQRWDGLGTISRSDVSRLLDDGRGGGDADLVIRTSGEQRLSDFLLWECAYAELYFTPKLWPDFTPYDLRAALSDFTHRDRRFGAVPAKADTFATPAK